MCFNIALLLIVAVLEGSLGLGNVTLLVMPRVVERGKTVELLCHYDLQGSLLYTIKFYRGTHEFYRYSPTDVPPIKLFPFQGLQVDLSSSQGSSVVIRDADYSLAGNISCEVSTEGPRFSTKTVTQCLTVVELPKKPPDIVVEDVDDVEWQPGDLLKATCTSHPARPAPSLTWFINDEPAMTFSTRWKLVGSLESRSVTLSTRLLSRHLVEGHVVVKCTALVLDVYKETTSKILGPSTLREPKHERVRSSRSPRLCPGDGILAVITLVLVVITR